MVGIIFFVMVYMRMLCFILQGETPLDLAKQRKNVWMINHLQEARQAKGYDSPSFLKRLKMDKVHTYTTSTCSDTLKHTLKEKDNAQI